MEIPQLIGERLGQESVTDTVNLGDEDMVCVTPTRTLVYRSEGLLSDESVTEYDHDVERITVSEGRRKTKFVLESVDRTDSFTVPGAKADTLLELLLGGVLHVAGVTDEDESVAGVYSFSELTLVVTSERLVKHVGAPVWDADFEVYPYSDVTGLSFEEGSVATQIVLSVGGRPERIKAPSDEARAVRRALTGALFAYYDVETLAELNDRVAESDPDQPESDQGELSLDAGISPLVSDPEHATDQSTTDSGGTEGSVAGTADPDEPSETRETPTGGAVDAVRTGQATDGESGSVDPADIEAIEEQLATLTTAVQKQNDLLRDQQETVDQLIEELRRGR